MLTDFNPPPGIMHDGTAYSSRGTWNNSDKMRFRGGFPERIGGWTRLTTEAFTGTCRHLFQWSALDLHTHLAIGTNLKYYVQDVTDGGLDDITPIRASSTINNNPFATTNGSPVVTV